MKQPVDKTSDEIEGKQNSEIKLIKKQVDDIFTSIDCDCCEEDVAAAPLSSTPSVNSTRATRTVPDERVKVDDSDHEDLDYDNEKLKRKKLFNDTKLLIIIGIVATVPIVFLELLLLDSLANMTIMLTLATTVQVLLGRPFYIRFFRAIKNRKRLTTDTLVVLSTFCRILLQHH